MLRLANRRFFCTLHKASMLNREEDSTYTAPKEEAIQEDSIFTDVIMSTDGTDELNLVSGTSRDLHFMNSVDISNMANAISPIHYENLPTGKSTFGMWEFVAYLDEVFTNQWFYLADELGLGMGAGLMVACLGARLAFVPLLCYTQITGIKMKLLQPDIDDIQTSMKRHMKEGNREATKVERAKLKQLRAKHGIYPMLSLMNLLQMPVHITWISLVNRVSFNYDVHRGIMTDGFLWFKDLSAPDPYGILPFVGASLTFLNILSTSTTNLNPTMRKLRRYMFLLPVLTIPVWMTFPAAFNLYWMSTSVVQLIILNLFRNLKFRQMLGIPQYLPGTKLERMNMKRITSVDKPKLQRHKPTK